MNLPQTEMIPDDPEQLPPARRRRARRLLTPLSADERAAFIEKLARRASPSFDFFLFSLIAGGVMGAGLAIDSPAVLVLGALLAPLMAPAVGVSLGTVIGSVRYFVRSLLGLLIGCALALSGGALAGLAAQSWPTGELTQAFLSAQLTWPGFIVLLLGAVLTCASMVRSDNPALPSVALAYELYLPLTAAGFGLTGGVLHLWPDGLVVFSVHLAWAALMGTFTLAILGFRPPTIFGYTLSGALTLGGIVLVIAISGAGAALGANIALPTATPTRTMTPSPTFTVTTTPVPPSPTNTHTLTPSPTSTLTSTPVPTPTPVYALVNAGDGGGAFLREQAGFDGRSITVLANGTLVEVLSARPLEVGNSRWVQVRAPDGQEGWMVDFVLVIATPAPIWTP